MDDSWLSSLILALLLLCAFYLASAEAAFSSVSRIRLKIAADKGDTRADRALFVLDNFDKAISTLLICTNIVQIIIAVQVTLLATRQWGVTAVAAASVTATMVVFFAGEMLPKSIAKKFSERFAISAAASLCFLMKIFTPLTFLLMKIGGIVSRLVKNNTEVTVTEDELYDIIESMKDSGEIDAERGELVHSALMFADVTVETILTARVDLSAIDVGDSCEEILAYIKSQKHSRLPVYEKNIDNIIGVLQIRKFFREYMKRGDCIDLRDILDEALFVHQSTRIDELLSELSRKKLNMAIVSDNYGGTLGIVTVEDILEELVGEIWDEDDVIVESYIPLPDGGYEFDASMPVDEVFELLDIDCPEDLEHKLMSEWAYEQFGKIPSEGDMFTYDTIAVTVSRMRNNRIVKLKAAQVRDMEGGESA